MRGSRYFELIIYKTYADLKSEVARTYVGYVWWVVEPIIQMVIWYVTFGVLLNRATEDFIQFLLIGVVPWKWFETSVKVAGNSILANTALMRQVPIPKIIFPTIVILTDSFKFAVAFLLLIVFLCLTGFGIGRSYLALPLVILSQALLMFALSYVLAAVVPFLPDLYILVDNGMRLLYVISGIFFSAESINENLRGFFYANPMATIMESYRTIMMHREWPRTGSLGLICLGSCAGIAVGAMLLSRFDKTYPRLVE